MPQSEPHQMIRERVTAKVQYIRDLSFEVPRAPALYQDIRLPPELVIGIDVHATLITAADRIYEVVLVLRVEGRDRQVPPNDPVSIEFIAELSYGGLFSLAAVPAEDTDEALWIDCPHILYPFACTILADLSRDANFAPIALGPVDFEKMWYRHAGRAPGETAS